MVAELFRRIRVGNGPGFGSKAVLGILMATMLVIGGAGVAVGSRLRSPAEVAASAAPPEKSPVTAPVTRKQLTSDIVTRGTIRFADPVVLTMNGTVGSPDGSSAALVTSVVEQGADLSEGDVALTVSGRPVFLLEGTVPMYRTIGLGATGDDVRQLEEALVRLGQNPGTVDGVADDALMRAVEAFYVAAGFKAQNLSSAQKGELDGLRDAVTAAERAVADAKQALTDAAKGTSALDKSRSDGQVQAARDELAAAQRRASSDAAGAQDDVAARQRALDDAQADLTAANAALQKANADKTAADNLSPADPDAVAEAVAAVATAQTAVTTANRAVQAAQADLNAAKRNLEGVGPAGQAAIDQARRSLSLAEAERAALDKAPDTAAQSRAVTAAEEGLKAARDKLAAFNAENGVSVPSGEIIFVPKLPLQVDSVKVKLGDAAGSGAELMTLARSELAVDSAVATADRDLIKVGAPVTISIDGFALEASGTVSEVEAKPGTRGVEAGRVYVGITLDQADLPAEVSGAPVRITIPIDATDGEVLTVPVTAVVTRASGETLVVVQRNGTLTEVKVRAGLAAGGEVEITPIDGDLAEGDWVVIDEGAAASGAGTEGAGSQGAEEPGSQGAVDPGSEGAEDPGSQGAVDPGSQGAEDGEQP